MTSVPLPAVAARPARSRLAQAWLLVALVDFVWAEVLSVGFYGSTSARLWQGVASVLLGPSAFEGGARAVAVGLLMHLTVALTWSTIFLVLHDRVPAVRRLTQSPGGLLEAAALYGPFVWAAMSLVVIPVLRQTPPNVTYRWFIQAAGHVFFVGLPIVWAIARRDPAEPRPAT